MCSCINVSEQKTKKKLSKGDTTESITIRNSYTPSGRLASFTILDKKSGYAKSKAIKGKRKHFTTDDYAKDGGSGEVCLSYNFYHDPLRV